MMTTDSKRITLKWLCLIGLFCGALAGCVDDDLLDCIDDVSVSTLASDEYGISFELSLDNYGGTTATRADWDPVGTKEENYVNFDHMRVLLFDKNDNYICDILANTDACNVVDRSTGNSHSWYIEVILSRLDEEIQDKFRDLVERDGFKVAVFANWDRRLANDPTNIHPKFEYAPNSDKPQAKLSYVAHNMYDSTYDSSVSEEGYPSEEGSEGPYKHLTDSEGNMGAWYDWVESHFESINHAYNLMHSGCKMTTLRDADSNAESRLDGNQGNWTYYDTSADVTELMYDEDGNGDIDDKGFYYKRTERDGQTYTFRNLWKLWNFSNGVKFPYYKQSYYTDEILKTQDAGYTSEREADYYIKRWETVNAKLVEDLKANKTDFLSDKFAFNNLKVNFSTGDKYDENTGVITLTPQAGTKSHDYDYLTNKAKPWYDEITSSYLKFKAEATGTLYVRVKEHPENNSYIGVGTHIGPYNERDGADNILKYRGYSNGKETLTDEEDAGLKNAVNRRDIDDRDGSFEDMMEYSFRVNVRGDEPNDVFVYVVGTGWVDFYEIEFVKDEYVYQVDRIGKQPGKWGNNDEMGIPMYGIQEFEPVGDYWLPGEFFNMSKESYNSNRKEGYKYRSVFLLRSVAKVELLVSKNIGAHVKPSSVYMASMNRTSRYEPKDFSTPTNLIWHGSDYYEQRKYTNYSYESDDEGNAQYTYKGKSLIGVDSEDTNIREHLLCESKYNSYQTYTAWLYGVWKSIIDDWDWNGHPNLLDKAEEIEPNKEYPRVFNDRVYRSNTVRFIYGGEVDGYYYYYLYMPDRYMDDDDNAGAGGFDEGGFDDTSKSPKVASIRLRFAEVDDDGNVLEFYNDDNNLGSANPSYRIYFTDGGRKSPDPDDPDAKNIGRDEYSSYERNLEDKHWPIIRNTLYRFTLDGLNSTDIKAEVCGAASRKVEIPEFK